MSTNLTVAGKPLTVPTSSSFSPVPPPIRMGENEEKYSGQIYKPQANSPSPAIALNRTISIQGKQDTVLPELDKLNSTMTNLLAGLSAIKKIVDGIFTGANQVNESHQLVQSFIKLSKELTDLNRQINECALKVQKKLKELKPEIAAGLSQLSGSYREELNKHFATMLQSSGVGQQQQTLNALRSFETNHPLRVELHDKLIKTCNELIIKRFEAVSLIAVLDEVFVFEGDKTVTALAVLDQIEQVKLISNDSSLLQRAAPKASLKELPNHIIKQNELQLRFHELNKDAWDLQPYITNAMKSLTIKINAQDGQDKRANQPSLDAMLVDPKSDPEASKTLNQLDVRYKKEYTALREKLLTSWNSLCLHIAREDAEQSLTTDMLRIKPQLCAIEANLASMLEQLRATRKGQKDNAQHVQTLIDIKNDYDKICDIVTLDGTAKKESYIAFKDDDKLSLTAIYSDITGKLRTLAEMAKKSPDLFAKAYLWHDDTSKEQITKAVEQQKLKLEEEKRDFLMDITGQWTCLDKYCSGTEKTSVVHQMGRNNKVCSYYLSLKDEDKKAHTPLTDLYETETGFNARSMVAGFPIIGSAFSWLTNFKPEDYSKTTPNKPTALSPFTQRTAAVAAMTPSGAEEQKLSK